MMSPFRTAFLQALARHGMTQAGFAAAASVSRSNVTYFLGGGVPNDALFRAIFAVWNHAETAEYLFRAYVREEAARAGVTWAGETAGDLSELLAIEEDLHALRRMLVLDPAVRPYVRRLAEDCRAAAAGLTAKSEESRVSRTVRYVSPEADVQPALVAESARVPEKSAAAASGRRHVRAKAEGKTQNAER